MLGVHSSFREGLTIGTLSSGDCASSTMMSECKDELAFTQKDVTVSQMNGASHTNVLTAPENNPRSSQTPVINSAVQKERKISNSCFCSSSEESTAHDQLHFPVSSEHASLNALETEPLQLVSKSGVPQNHQVHFSSPRENASDGTFLTSQRGCLEDRPSPKVHVKRKNTLLWVAVLCIAVIVGVGGGISSGIVGYHYSLKNARDTLSIKNRLALNASVSALHDSWQNLVGDALGLKNFVQEMELHYADPAAMRDALNFTFFVLSVQTVQSSQYIDYYRLIIPFCADYANLTLCSKALYLAYECEPHRNLGMKCFYYTNDDSGEFVNIQRVSIDNTARRVKGMSYVGSRPMKGVTLYPEMIAAELGFFLPPSASAEIGRNDFEHITYSEQILIKNRFVECDAGSYLENWYTIFDRNLQKDPVSYAMVFDASGVIQAYSYGSAVTHGVPCFSKHKVYSLISGVKCGTGGGKVLDGILKLLMGRGQEIANAPVIRDANFSFVTESDGLVIAFQSWFHIEKLFNTDHTVFFAVYATPVVSGLDKEGVFHVFICVFIVMISILILGGISIFFISQLQKTLELVSILAFYVSTYDLDSVQAILHTPRGFRFPYGVLGIDLLREFSRILDNLRAYRPFLPQALLTNLCNHGSKDCVNAGALLSEDEHHDQEMTPCLSTQDSVQMSVNPLCVRGPDVFCSNEPIQRLKRVKGTVLIVELYASPTEELKFITLVDSFLAIVLAQARICGGVTDRIEAKQVLITFNFYTPLLRHQHRACKCALAIQEGLIKAGIIAFIAITTGYNFVGTIGTTEQKAHVVTGFSVDLAKRLVKLHSILGTRVLVTQQVAHESSVASIPVDKIEVFSQDDNTMVEQIILEVVAHDGNGMTAEHMFAKMLFSCVLHSHTDDAVTALRHYMKKYSLLDDVPWYARRIYELCLHNSKLIDEGYKRKGMFWEPLEGEEFINKYFMDEKNRTKCFLSDARVSLGRSGDSGLESTDGYPSFEMSPVDDVQFAKMKIGEESLLRSSALKEKKQGDAALFSLYLTEKEPRDEDSELPDVSAVTIRKCTGVQTRPASRPIQDIKQQIYYLTDQLLGKGRSGEVYLGMSDSGNFVATKILPFEENGSALVSEVEALIELRHDHIVTYDTCAIKDGRFYIFTEYMAAGSMRSLINRVGPLPEKAARKYARDILFGLQFLHHMKYIHCDIKPDNVLLSCEGTCKLSDFGGVQLARSVGDRASMIRGTPRYMAPENVFGNYTYKSDIYSFGLTLVYMLVEGGPWNTYIESDEAFLVRLTQDGSNMKPKFPTNLVDKSLENAIQMCCEFNPEKRPSVDELLTMLS